MAAPAGVAAVARLSSGTSLGLRVEKKPVRRRGWGVSRVLPACRAWIRTYELGAKSLAGRHPGGKAKGDKRNNKRRKKG